MLIQPWIDECCTVHPATGATIGRLWASYRRWLERQADMTPYLVNNRWPIQKQLREALLANGFVRGGYGNAPQFVGIAPKLPEDNRWT